MLTQALGYNNPKFKKLASMYPSIRTFIEGGEREWRLCGLFTVSDMDKLAGMKVQDAQRVLERCEQLRYSVLTIDDDAYPGCLYHIYAPPAVLYINGTMPDWNNVLSIGIVGTRRASRYGTENSYKIAYALSKFNTVIVSGGALGVDCASHRGALAANGVTVCVRGCGINSHYLKDNEKMRQAIASKGAVISEYPPDEEPRGYYFPARNRLIAALSDGLLVIEAGAKSGSLITADLALEMGKDLFALLGNNSPSNEGSNNRIKEGTAIPVTDFMDILAVYDKKNADPQAVDFNQILLADIDAIPVKKGDSRTDDVPAPPKKPPKARKARKAENSDNAEKKGKRRKKEKNPQNPQAVSPAAAVPQEAPPKHKDVKLTGDAKKIYAYLSADPVHIDAIAGDLGMPVNRVLSTLTLLEVQGLARALPGRNYVLK